MIGVDTTFLVQLEIVELPLHQAAHSLLDREILNPGVNLALAPQVLTEFLHIVKDPRRFTRPLTMQRALSREGWWNAREVTRVYQGEAATNQMVAWLGQFLLGRKRLLNTPLAATLWCAGIRKLITSNSKDFQPFGFEVLSP